MGYSTLQKDLERITLKKDLDQALERMVDFEEEVDRNEEESEDEEEEEFEEEEEKVEYLSPIRNYMELAATYFFGVTVGVIISFSASHQYINGRSEDNQRRESQRS